MQKILRINRFSDHPPYIRHCNKPGFRVGMLQNGGFGAIPWGEVANREPGSYIYIYIKNIFFLAIYRYIYVYIHVNIYLNMFICIYEKLCIPSQHYSNDKEVQYFFPV